MARRRQLNGVLHGFLGTITSRYSEFNGYWLFGFLVGRIRPLKIDLMGTTIPRHSRAPVRWTISIARRMFEDQVTKAGLTLAEIREASLTVRTVSGFVITEVGDPPRRRHCQEVKILVQAVLQDGRTSALWTPLMVAKHDPHEESQAFTQPDSMRPDSRTLDQTP